MAIFNFCEFLGIVAYFRNTVLIYPRICSFLFQFVEHCSKHTIPDFAITFLFYCIFCLL